MTIGICQLGELAYRRYTNPDFTIGNQGSSHSINTNRQRVDAIINPIQQFLSQNCSGAALLLLNNSTGVTLFRVDSCTGCSLGNRFNSSTLAVVFDYVSRHRKRICDGDKMLLSLIAVSVEVCLVPLYFKIVELSLSL